MKRWLPTVLAVMLASSMCVVAFAADDNAIIPVDGEEKVFVASSSEASSTESSKSESSSSSSTSSEGVFEKPPTYGSDETIKDKSKDYTADIFYAPEFDIDRSEAKPINDTVRRWASVVISVVVNLLPLGLVIFTLLDIMCLLFPPVLWLFANVMPLQLYSSEVEEITGVTFGSGKKEGAGPGAKMDLQGKNPIFFYARNRVGVVFVALLIVVLIVSGLWLTISSWLINIIVNGLMSFIHV